MSSAGATAEGATVELLVVAGAAAALAAALGLGAAAAASSPLLAAASCASVRCFLRFVICRVQAAWKHKCVANDS